MEIRLDAPSKFKVVRTDDGRLHCEGVFCRDGILEYRQPDGKIIRELRRSETNADPKTVESFKLLPLVVEHPPVGLLDSTNYKNFAVGLTDSSVHYDSSEGTIKGLVSFFDAKAIAHIDAKEKEELSAGYTCDIKPGEGVWNGQRYDREQINVRANHLALTSKGRAGEDVRLRLDSDAGIGRIIDSDPLNGETIKRMASIRCDGVEYSDIPEAFASVAGARFKELEELKPRFDAFQEKLENLTSQLKAIEQERNDSKSLITTLESALKNADQTLSRFGYKRTDGGDYIRVDGKKGKKHVPPMDAEEDPDDDMETEDTEDPDVPEDMEDMEEEVMPKKKTKKTVKEDSDSEYKQDSVSDLLAAWKEADELVPGFSEYRFDNALSVSDIKRSVIAEIEPNLDLSIRSDAYVDGVFLQIKTSQLDRMDTEEEEEETEEEAEEETREDSQLSIDYTQRLDAALKSGCKCEDEGITEWEKRRVDAYKKPLTMSKSSMGMMK